MEETAPKTLRGTLHLDDGSTVPILARCVREVIETQTALSDGPVYLAGLLRMEAWPEGDPSVLWPNVGKTLPAVFDAFCIRMRLIGHGDRLQSVGAPKGETDLWRLFGGELEGPEADEPVIVGRGY